MTNQNKFLQKADYTKLDINLFQSITGYYRAQLRIAYIEHYKLNSNDIFKKCLIFDGQLKYLRTEISMHISK